MCKIDFWSIPDLEDYLPPTVISPFHLDGGLESSKGYVFGSSTIRKTSFESLSFALLSPSKVLAWSIRILPNFWSKFDPAWKQTKSYLLHGEVSDPRLMSRFSIFEDAVIAIERVSLLPLYTILYRLKGILFEYGLDKRLISFSNSTWVENNVSGAHRYWEIKDNWLQFRPFIPELVKLSILQELSMYGCKGEISVPLPKQKTKTFSEKGLYSEQIFGPLTSFCCACHLIQNFSADEISALSIDPFNNLCPICYVEATNTEVRRHRLGIISFKSPMVHPWYVYNNPSYLALFLNIPTQMLFDILNLEPILGELALPKHALYLPSIFLNSFENVKGFQNWHETYVEKPTLSGREKNLALRKWNRTYWHEKVFPVWLKSKKVSHKYFSFFYNNLFKDFTNILYIQLLPLEYLYTLLNLIERFLCTPVHIFSRYTKWTRLFQDLFLRTYVNYSFIVESLSVRLDYAPFIKLCLFTKKQPVSIPTYAKSRYMLINKLGGSVLDMRRQLVQLIASEEFNMDGNSTLYDASLPPFSFFHSNFAGWEGFIPQFNNIKIQSCKLLGHLNSTHAMRSVLGSHIFYKNPISLVIKSLKSMFYKVCLQYTFLITDIQPFDGIIEPIMQYRDWPNYKVETTRSNKQPASIIFKGEYTISRDSLLSYWQHWYTIWQTLQVFRVTEENWFHHLIQRYLVPLLLSRMPPLNPKQDKRPVSTLLTQRLDKFYLQEPKKPVLSILPHTKKRRLKKQRKILYWFMTHKEEWLNFFFESKLHKHNLVEDFTLIPPPYDLHLMTFQALMNERRKVPYCKYRWKYCTLGTYLPKFWYVFTSFHSVTTNDHMLQTYGQFRRNRTLTHTPPSIASGATVIFDYLGRKYTPYRYSWNLNSPLFFKARTSTHNSGISWTFRTVQWMQKRLCFIFHLLKLHPSWFFFVYLPVLPPGLRPIYQVSFLTYTLSDLTKQYRSLLIRNQRLCEPLNTTLNLTLYNNLFLQESINFLFNHFGPRSSWNSSRWRPSKGLVLLKQYQGKYGRFRFNLLGKRIDYSARSVITSGSGLPFSYCTIPLQMGFKLLEPMWVNRMLEFCLVQEENLEEGYVDPSLLSEQDNWDDLQVYDDLLDEDETSEEINLEQSLVANEQMLWPETLSRNLLQELIQNRLILINRAPTLHRMNFQAFHGLPNLARNLGFYPVACSSFNADFDGDQTAIFMPLSFEVLSEAYHILQFKQNLISPATQKLLGNASQDIVLGMVSLNSPNETRYKSLSLYFSNWNDFKTTANHGLLPLQSKSWVRIMYNCLTLSKTINYQHLFLQDLSLYYTWNTWQWRLKTHQLSPDWNNLWTTYLYIPPTNALEF
uniref:DNA-directed RNA polymerase subunit n=1 Tax=Chromera velia TaxID=505693 RepID=D9IXE1_9ALVE|nr:RNA polymerase beta' subunit [Chromera velia]ADJ66549.2 RNA polymerase beta' subunit [Chromera velia]